MPSVFVLVNASLSACISVAGSFINALIVYCFFTTKSLQTINNTFLVQLAIIDFIKAVTILSVKSYKQFFDKNYVHPFYCQLSGVISTIAFVHSAMLLTAIAVVRYFKVVKPMQFHKVFSKKRMLGYCIGMFLAVFALALLPIIGIGEYAFSKHHGVCFVHWLKKNVVFRCLFYVYAIILCYPVMIFCYSRIFAKLRKHKRTVTVSICSSSNISNVHEKADGPNLAEAVTALKKRSEAICNETASPCKDTSQTDEPAKVTEPSDTTQDVGDGQVVEPGTRQKQDVMLTASTAANAHARNNKRLARNEIRVTKLMFLIVITYSVCWLPAFIINLLMIFEIDVVSDKVLYLVITLLDFKVLLNPLIYGILNYQFRAHLREWLCARKPSKQANDNNNNSNRKDASS